MDECACREVYTVSRGPWLRPGPDPTPCSLTAPALARSRAASSAVSVLLEAVSWMTPPPAEVDRNPSGRPSRSTSQSITCVSSSVHAGLVAHSMPWTPRPEESRSPRIEGPEALAGKYAKKFGDCQWVIPGMTISSMSRSTSPNGSPCSGAERGSRSRIEPGSTCESTG